MTSIPIRELARQVEAVLEEDADLEITGVGTLQEAGPTELTFLGNLRYAEQLTQSRAGAVLLPHDYDREVPMAALRTPNPYLALARALDIFHAPRPRSPGIHPTAVVPASCTLGHDVSIGPYVVLGESVRLGDGVTLHAHCVLYDDVVVGPGTTLHSFVAIREGVSLGANVEIHNGSVIGADGFGLAPLGDGRTRKIPQVGTVRVEDDVEIQANACVDRASLGATVVGRGTKIDNLVQVGHSCTIGEDAILCGQVALAGSSHIGDRVVLAGQSGVAGHLRIGDGAQVSAQAGVMGDVEGGGQYAGTPASDVMEQKRIFLSSRRLPAALKELKDLRRRIERIEASLAEHAD